VEEVKKELQGWSEINGVVDKRRKKVMMKTIGGSPLSFRPELFNTKKKIQLKM
jgi:hypothetical protein